MHVANMNAANQTVHVVPLAEGNMNVPIDVALDKAVLLPIPVTEQ